MTLLTQELVRTRHGFKAASEKSGVPVGALIVAVNKDRVFAHVSIKSKYRVSWQVMDWHNQHGNLYTQISQ